MLALGCLSLWLWRGNMSRDRRIFDLTTERANILAASEEAAKMYKAREADMQRQLFDSAKEAQTDHDEIAQDLNAALARYRAANRLPRQAAYCGSSAAASEGGDPGVPAQVLPDPGMVAVSETDLQALVDWLAVGVADHNQSVKDIEEGRAMPDPAFSAEATNGN